jgi:hypothetical protein
MPCPFWGSVKKMAEEFEGSDGRRVLRPRIANVRFKERERSLFEGAEHLPNWLEPAMLREAAGISAAAITIRAASSGMALVSCGYVVESGQALRRAQEARLHAQAAYDDASGAYAARFLQRRGSNLSKLAQRYQVRQDVDILSALVHADVHGLHLLGFESDSRGPGSIAIDTRPRRDDRKAGMALYLLTQASLQMTRMLSLIFDIEVEVPPWISAEVNRIDQETQAEVDAATK